MAQNIFAQGMDAFDRGYDRQQTITDRMTRRKAGQRYASGDPTGAAQELAGAGMIEQAQGIEQDQRQQEREQFSRDRIEQTDRQAAAQRNADLLTRLAQGLKTVPAGQRKQALSRAYPLFQGAGIDTATLDQLTEEQLSDQSLDAFTGEVQKHLQIVNRGGGGYDVVDTRTGQAVRSVEPDPKMVTVGDGAVLIDPATRKPVYANPKNFAPRSSGANSLPPPPAGWSPAR